MGLLAGRLRRRRVVRRRFGALRGRGGAQRLFLRDVQRVVARREVALVRRQRRLDGRGSIDLSELRGKQPVVLDFWASWCTPCIQESKRLESARKQYGDRIAFIGVDTKDFSEDARQWQRRHGITHPSVHDGGGDVLAKWGGLPIPKIFFIARSGKVIGELEAEEDLPRYLRQIASS